MRAAIDSSRESVRLTRDRRLAREANVPERHRLESNADPGPHGSSSYSDRVPQRQSLYDWAPAGERRHEGLAVQDWGSDGHTPWQTRTPDERPSRRGVPSSSTTGSSRMFTHLLEGTQSAELRSSALTQAIRRHPRLSQRSHSGLESYMLERGRRNDGGETDQSTHPRLLRPPSMINPADRRHGIPTSELRSSVEAYRQRYLHNPANDESEVGGVLDEAIRYLDQLRCFTSHEESLAVAMASGIISQLGAQASFPAKTPDDLVVNTNSVPPPAESSWLRVGGVFEGTQHAAGAPNAVRRRLPPSYSEQMSGTSNQVPTGDSMPISNPLDSQYHHLPGGPDCIVRDGKAVDRFDRWPVKVTIHSVDYDTMQLSGEMEAFDVPDRTAPDRKSSITTYLEGEIIDLSIHSFETKNFRSSPRIDAIYWHKLLPFRGYEEIEMVENLLSRKWLREHISQDWILMRWKGKDSSFSGAIQPGFVMRKEVLMTMTHLSREMLHHTVRSTSRSDHLWILLHISTTFRWLRRRLILRSRKHSISTPRPTSCRKDIPDL